MSGMKWPEEYHRHTLPHARLTTSDMHMKLVKFTSQQIADSNFHAANLFIARPFIYRLILTRKRKFNQESQL